MRIWINLEYEFSCQVRFFKCKDIICLAKISLHFKNIIKKIYIYHTLSGLMPWWCHQVYSKFVTKWHSVHSFTNNLTFCFNFWFSGQLSVWDLSQEDEPLLASSGIGDDSHREPITQIVWLQNPDKPSKYLVKLKGLLMIWDVSKKCGTFLKNELFLY